MQRYHSHQHNVIPSMPARTRTAKPFLLAVMLAVLCLGSVGTMSCRDVTRMCQKYVDKYQMCTQKRYEQAQRLQTKLSPQAKKRSEALLQQLQQRLKSPAWRQRHMQLCVKSPPSNQRFRCVYQTACSALSRCNPQMSSLTPQTTASSKD